MTMRLDESVLNRRDFLDGLVAAGVATWTGVAAEMTLSYLTGREIPEPDQIIVAGEPLETLAARRFVLVPYGPRPVLLFRLPDGELRALSAICTHGQCNVQYRPEENDIFCGCHKGRFDSEGTNIEGPPPRPLRRFYLQEQADGTLLVSHQPIEQVPPPGIRDDADNRPMEG